MRINVIDIIKGIAIIMIVNVHLIGGPCFPIGSTFHVVSFFFVSGIVHGINEKWKYVPIRTFFKQKVLRLLFPYLTLSVCYIVCHILINIFRGDPIMNDVIVYSLINTFTFRGIGTLWFLPTLFLGELFFFISKSFHVHNWICVIIGLGAVLLSSLLNAKGICGVQWYGDHSLYGVLVNSPLSLLLASIIAYLFITLGYVGYKALPKGFLISDKPNRTMTLIVFVCLISFALDLFCLKYYCGDLHKLNIGNPFIFLLCSLSGILFVSSLSLIIERYTKYTSSVLEYCGRNSLIIMTTHTEYYINSLVHVALIGVFSLLGFSVGGGVLSVLSLFIILLVEIGICSLVNHSCLRYLYCFPKRSLNAN